MRLRNKLISLAAGALALIGLSSPAGAVPLTDLLAGGTIVSGNNITFFGFTATILGDISGDPADYDVSALPTGFRIIGPFSVADGNAGEMLLSYTAFAAEGVISSATLSFNGSFNMNGNVSPPGALAGVNETLCSTEACVPLTPLFADSNLSVAASSGGLVKLIDTYVLPEAQQFFGVAKDITVSTVGLDQAVAHISVIDQTFEVVPEPGTLLLGSAGLLGLATLGRKRLR
jgi:hypothetical protein